LLTAAKKFGLPVITSWISRRNAKCERILVLSGKTANIDAPANIVSAFVRRDLTPMGRQAGSALALKERRRPIAACSRFL